MKRDKILILMIVIGLLVSGFTVTDRVTAELNNDRVDIILDYDEISKLAEESSYDIKWWFKQFKKLGVTSVALQEENFKTLMDEKELIQIEIMENIVKSVDWKEIYPKVLVDYIEDIELDPFDMVVRTSSKDLYDFIKKGLETRYDEKRYTILEEENEFIFILDGQEKDALYAQEELLRDSTGMVYLREKKLAASKLIFLTLGLDNDKIGGIKESGLKVIPRPYNYEGWNDEQYVQKVWESYKELDIIPKYLVSTGQEVLGYPDAIQSLKPYLENDKVKIALVENAVQRGHIGIKGLEELVIDLDYSAVRTFTIWPYIQKRFQYYNYSGAEEIENTLYRAITERNIRLIYFKPFLDKDDEYVTDYKEYEKMFIGLEKRLASHGITFGDSSTIPPLKVGFLRLIIMGLGVVGGSVLLASYLFNLSNSIKYALSGLGFLGVTASYWILPSWIDKGLALGAAMIFPSLAMIYFCRSCREYFLSEHNKINRRQAILNAIKTLLIASCISLLGAVFESAILGNTKYLLEMDIFRGVKLAQLAPLVIYLVTYIAYFGYKNETKFKDQPKLAIEDIKTFIFDKVRVIHVMGGCVLLIIGYIYIARTGHETNLQPSTIEMMFRNFLENQLLARPRTKEFLIAFPIFMVGIYAAIRRYKLLVFISGLVAVIGQTSIVNTFSHLRSPIVLSTVRTIFSVSFGIVLGVIYILILEVSLRFAGKLRGDK